MKVRDAGTSVPLAGRYVGLSGTQRSLWFHYLKDPELQGFFNISFVTRIEPRIDAPRLQRVLSELARRHTMFRVSFATVDGKVVQQAHAEVSIPLQVIDMSEDVVAIERRISIERHRPFDTAVAPLVRATLYQAGQSFSVLVFTMDHLICDGWSGWQVTEQIVRMLGEDFASAGSQPWQPGPEFRRSPANHGDFFDHVLQQQQWLAGPQARRQLEYWKQELAHLTEPLELNYQHHAPERRAVAVVKLDEGLVRGLNALAKRHGVTLYVVLLASYLMLLRRLTGNAQLAVGAPMPGRSKEWYECFGVFNNTVVLRAELTAGMCVAELVVQLRGTLFRALKNQMYPFAELARHLRTQSDQPDRSFFQVWFNHQNTRIDSELANLGTPVDVDAHVRCGELVLRPFGEWRGSGGPGVDLLLETIEIGTQIRADLDYNAGRFDHATIERYLNYWQRLLAAMVSNDAEQIDRLPMLSDAERGQLLYLWNAPTGTASQPQCIHELFEQQVARTPLLVALEEGEQRLSYAELNARANQLARRLRELGVGPEQRVALSMERSIDMVVGVLAILKAGGTYVPLEPSYPALRLSYILQDAAPCLLLTQRALRDVLPASGVPVFEVDAGWEGVAAPGSLDSSNLPSDPRLTATQIASITYTSGSTGQPKGVMADHARTVNRVLDQVAIAPLQVGEKCAQKTAIGFVDAIFETLHPLLAGATLVIIPNAIAAQVHQLAATLAAHHVTRWITVPSLASALLLDEQCVQQLQGLRHWLLSGEALPAHLLGELRRQLPHCCFINIYGASEAADATYYVGGMLQDESRVPIGRPLANTQIYILDAQGAPVPVGVPGEIHVGGASLARGYLNLPELTAQRFLQDPFSSQPGARMYRTGDVGRWRSDGHIEYLGRNDQQVKIRGFRIELPEIEARLRGLEGVSDTVVVLSARAPGEERLVAYYVGTELSPQALRTHLSQSLPEYMVPAAYVWLPALPLTPNGKLDRAALPLPGADAYSQAAYAAPEGPVEELLAQLWRELLQVERVGRHDHFFRLGGHSLLAVQLVARVRQVLQRQIGLRDVFAAPVLQQMSGRLSQFDVVSEVRIERGERGAHVPLSLAQQRLWFIAQLEGVGSAYHVGGAVRLEGELDEAALRRALDTIVQRHEVLRTVFRMEEGEAVQVIAAQGSFALEVVDLRALEGSQREVQVRVQALQESEAGFDLQRGPLIRGRLLQLAEQAHVLLVTMHHLVSDGWSVGILLRELGALYGSYRQGGGDVLAALPIQYADYAQWQRRGMVAEVLQRQLRYWQEHLVGAPWLLELPTDRPRGAVQSYAGSSVRVSLGERLSEQVRELSRCSDTTLHMTLLAGWSVLLSRLSGQGEVVVGTVVANRQRVEVEGLIGCFVNTLALRVRVRAEQQVQELLGEVKAVTLGGYAHQEVPFEQVVEVVQPPRSLSHSAVFQAMLVLQNAPRSVLQLPGLNLASQGSVSRTSKFDLTLTLQEVGQEIVGELEYASDLFDRSTIERWSEYFKEVLAQMARDPQQRVGALSMLGAQERQQVLVQFNATATAYAQDRCVHELFEAQVQRSGQAVALVHADEQLTYGELNARANRLARYLCGLGVQPDTRVGICVERGIEMVVAVLGVLKAGAAYVPLDARYPRERLSYMLQDSAPAVVLTQQRLKAVLPASDAVCVALDSDWSEITAQADSNLAAATLGLSARHLAYVIYTSGSTGAPKGVMVEHRGVVNFLRSMQGEPGLSESDCVLAVTTLSFDIAALELFLPLACGAKVVIASRQVTVEAQLLWQALRAHAVTMMQATPATWRMLIDGGWSGCRTLKALCGGEALSAELSGALKERVAEVWNLYGPTETSIWSCAAQIVAAQAVGVEPIGRPIANTQIYILDAERQPVPIGVAGEIYIGGAGVARGYLNRAELTAQRFVADPYSGEAQARMYKSGDVGRWREDGSIEYLGRNDDQVKIRGFRIELGEIEAQLLRHAAVKDAVVVARQEEDGEKRLVGYVTLRQEDAGGASVEQLREYLRERLPAYMVPGAYVVMEKLPLTPNGKLDRKGLPAPQRSAWGEERYEAPQGELEARLAGIWQGLLRVPRVGRHDNFFELGGHSLLAMKLIDQLQQHGLQLQVRSLFSHPTLAALAADVVESSGVAVPDNLIPAGTTTILPQMLPLIELRQDEIDSIVTAVDGGVTNVQDIYPLTAPQEGILFHYLLEQRGDAYVLPSLLRFDSRARLDEFVTALGASVARHDNLRTSFHWEGLTQPVQVVWRHTQLSVSCLDLDPTAGSAIEQLRARFGSGSHRLDVRRAPLMQLYIAPDAQQAGWLLMLVSHHLIHDNTSLQALLEEMQLQRRGVPLPAAVPYRNFVARLRSDTRAASHDAFFREMLAGVEEPTLPFGLDALGGVREVQRARTMLAVSLSENLRRQASELGVSVASLCHLAWARLIACAAGLEQAVFGTVLFGRMQAGAGAARAGGVFTNTLPICLAADGGAVRMRVIETHRRLAQLLQHEDASLAAAQRCSSLPSATPLFSVLLNYRHGIVDGRGDLGWPGAELIDSEEGSHYPLRLSIDALEGGFMLTAHAPAEVGAQRVCDLMTTVLQGLVTALAEAPDTPVNRLPVLTAVEQQQVLYGWNTTGARPAAALCVHELFERQVARTPLLVALEEGQQRLSYADLNSRANQLARYLRELGVGPEQRVALSMERSIELVVSVLAILKAGGTYVPLEPSYPAVRLNYILQDAAPCLLLTQSALRESLPASNVPVFEVDAGWEVVATLESSNLPSDARLTPSLLACITYTSGSTGHPKGVMADHARTVNRVLDQVAIAPLAVGEKCAQKTAIGFVDAIFETLHPLLAGATLVIIANSITTQVRQLTATLAAHRVTRWITVPSLASALLLDEQCVQQLQGLRYWLLSGEALPADLLGELRRQLPRCCFINIYGASEAADATYYVGGTLPDESRVPIGRALPNTQIYILDAQGAPVPVGVPGEIHVGGASVARGYLNQPELTAQRFLQDPFSLEPSSNEPTSIEPTSIEPGARMYRTGDLGRWRSDGQIEYLGRNDHQVKIRGFRIELGEIETCLRAHAQLSDVVVLARAVTTQDKHLVAYYISTNDDIDAETLRSYAAATLPHFMVPAAYVRLASFPLSPNGKLDRRALPAPEGNAYARGAAYDAPRGEIETRLAQLWMELLKVDRVGRRDNFFELGGHSLLAVSLSQLIAVRLQVEVSIAEVFEHPELAQLAAWVTEAMLEQFDADDLLELVEL